MGARARRHRRAAARGHRRDRRGPRRRAADPGRARRRRRRAPGRPRDRRPAVDGLGRAAQAGRGAGAAVLGTRGRRRRHLRLPAAWLGRPLDPPPAAAAERTVLLRFLAANGPATAADVARWWGEQPAPARRTVRAAADALAEVVVDGEPGFLVRAEDLGELAAVPDGGTDPADAPLLLPGFDPWVIAPLSHRARAVPADRTAEVSRTAGWISPVLVVDGVVPGCGSTPSRTGRPC
ncbi:winged helix DNA-binding domain-containing protein [Pseudonocardia sp. KRD-184]|uniref:Winged helix DNA-binding domain-containing protein n=1 Tax=Pseudonocardia oceani TaxID=2792013 RepID=A0ABS6UH26_9PSEU|nr:winged helix DNA-binding domain-containing protein [Pseudonocardia oceani]MBW0096220.1 winged helix DNA-binding domain-containing protein [Pseudonocardia oceani]MBW0111085.1 winged helix DNA-binding domain-containing protein [Pseudonocardia oceani]MBW0120112.1 winged helix DNA-binding domain-containing protein [Pseudonocardia oceani]MBW0131532.1 winged helix DNA-binding domain-containing protein [Pseudonocardia oceani]